VAVGFPLTVLGSIIGKNRAGSFDAPCRTRSIPREIPPPPWYHHPLPQLLMAGFLPFRSAAPLPCLSGAVRTGSDMGGAGRGLGSAISIELYYIFATVWGHKLYTLYGILLIVFAILIIVTSFITIALTYFQLSVEDYHWWWRSIINGGCVRTTHPTLTSC
jgi:transmembrane 9 superfamily member 1